MKTIRVRFTDRVNKHDMCAIVKRGAFIIFGEKRVYYRFAISDAPMEGPVPWMDYPCVSKKDLLVSACTDRLGACKAARDWCIAAGDEEWSHPCVCDQCFEPSCSSA
eukprot:1340619-Amphidinium_carterae.3